MEILTEPSLPTPTSDEEGKQKFFVDRETQRDIFRQHLAKISPDKKLLIFYSGAGGVGKTSLIESLKDFLTNASVSLQFKYASYDFTQGVEMVAVLTALKKALIDTYQVEFPLFEKGYLNYLMKRGEAVNPRQINDVLNQSSVLAQKVQDIRKTIRNVSGKLDNVNLLARGASIIVEGGFEFMGHMYNTSTILRVAQFGLEKINKFIDERAHQARIDNDPTYANILNKLDEYIYSPQSEKLKEFLPVLFARDLSDWLKEKSTKLVIFLDTYEALTEDEKSSKRHEKLVSINKDVPVDWWIEKLILKTSRVLWVIAGRSEVQKIGEEIRLVRGNGLFPLNALDTNFADNLLEQAGIQDIQLREGLVKLTGGYPIFLSLCVEIYKEIINSHKTPGIANFGKAQKFTVERLLQYMDESARATIYRLCVLGNWTDTIAENILAEFNENPFTYERVKSLSFITYKPVDFDEKILYSFDRSIQKILLDHLNISGGFFKIFLTQTRNAANNFFHGIFYEDETTPRRRIFKESNLNRYFRIWYEIILRATNADELVDQYEKFLAPLTPHLDNFVAETAINAFRNKIRNELGTENISHARFNCQLAQIRLSQDKIKEALALAESAYKKFEITPDDETPAESKIAAMNTLADVYRELKRTAKEMHLRRQALVESEKTFGGELSATLHPQILEAKKNLADVFQRGDRKRDALRLRKEIYTALKPFGNFQTIDAAENYIDALIAVNRFNEALMRMEKFINLCRGTNDTAKLIRALDKITWLLSKFSRTEYHRRELAFRRELIDLYENVEGEYSQKIIHTFNYVTYALKYFGKFAETTQALKNLEMKFQTRLELSDDDEERVELMQQLETILNWSGKPDEAAQFSAQIKQLIRKIIDDKTTAPIEDYDAVISALKSLLGKIYFTADYPLILKVDRKILQLTESKVGARDDEIISAMENLAGTLECTPEGYSEAIQLRENALAMLKSNDADAKKILQAMYKVASSYRRHHLENYSETLNWGKRILNFCRENFLSDAPEVIDAMEHLASVYEEMQNYVDAEKLRTKIAAIKESKRGDKSNSDVIAAEVDVADRLHDAGKYDEELAIRQEIVELYRKNSEYNAVLNLGRNGNMMVRAMDNVAQLLDNLGRDKDAHEVRKNIVAELKEDYDAIVEEFGSDSEYALFKLNDIVNALANTGNVEEEISYRERAIKLQTSTFKPSSPETIRALETLSKRLHDFGKEDDALKVIDEIVTIRQNVLEELRAKFPDDNAEKLRAMENLLQAELRFGRVEEAELLRAEILSAKRRVAEHLDSTLGKKSLDGVAAWENLADWCTCAEALEIRRNILTRIKIIYADNNTKVLDEMRRIAAIHKLQKNYPAALQTCREILDLALQMTAGQECNATVIDALKDVAEALHDVEDYAAELSLRLKIADLYAKFHKETTYKHDDTINAMKNIVRALVQMKNFEQAATEQEIVLALLKEKLNDNDEKVCDATIKLADLREAAGNYRAALNLRNEVVKIFEETPESVTRNWRQDIYASMYALANTLDKLDCHIEAEGERERVIAKLRANLDKTVDAYGENSDRTIALLTKLADAFRTAKDTRAEIATRMRLVKILRDFKGDASDKSIAAMNTLAETYDGYKPTEAATIRKTIATLQKGILISRLEKFGSEHFRTIEIRENLATTLERLGIDNEAATLREENLHIHEVMIGRRVEKFGGTHEITLDAMRKLASDFEKLSRYDDAEKIRNVIVEIYSEKFADDRTNYKIVDALRDMDALLMLRKNFEAALTVRREIVNLLKIRYAGYENHSEVVRAEESVTSLLEMPSIDTSNSASLRKGQKFDLTRNKPQLSSLKIIFGWDAASELTIDHSAYLLGGNGKVRTDEDLVFYNNAIHESGGVEYMEIPAQLNIELDKIPDDVAKIDFTLTIYDAEANEQNFSQVEGAYIAVIDVEGRTELLRFDLSQNFSVETAIIAGEIYRYKGDWKFNAIGAGFSGGLEALCANFGVMIE